MAFVKLDDVYLYTGLTSKAQQCYEMKKWLTDNNVKFTSLHYNDDAQHPELFAALNTWWEGVTFSEFPILICTEVHDDMSISQYPKRYYKSLEDAQASDFLQNAPRNV